jgi:hypothetical protein
MASFDNAFDLAGQALTLSSGHAAAHALQPVQSVKVGA